LDGSDESHLGADVLLSDRQVLFETLNWLHSYESEVHMQGHTDVDARNAHRHLLRGLTALHDTIVPQCLPPMPTHDENADFWNDLVFEVDQMLEPKTEDEKRRFQYCKWIRLKSVALAIDGIEIRIGRPGVDERTRYSAKKKQHAINVLVLVSLTGKFVAISDPQDGPPNDQGLWKATGWRKSASSFALFSSLCVLLPSFFVFDLVAWCARDGIRCGSFFALLFHFRMVVNCFSFFFFFFSDLFFFPPSIVQSISRMELLVCLVMAASRSIRSTRKTQSTRGRPSSVNLAPS
jgi:hypothetical protein